MKFKLMLILAVGLLLIIVVVGFLVLNITKNSNLVQKTNQVPIIIGFAQLGSESAWRNANTASVISAADKDGVSLVFENAKGSQQLQKDIIRDFIIEQVDVIIFAPIVATGWDEILAEAKKAKIPVIIADRTMETKDPTLYSVFVGEDFALEGEKAAKWLLNNTNPNFKVNIVELKGSEGSSPTMGRASGFRRIIESHSNIIFLKSVYGDFLKVRGKLEMKKLLSEYGGNINVVFAHNDDMALGAIEAIDEYGLRPGKDILIISFDGGKAALQAIKDGKLNVSVECTPLLGPTLIDTAEKLYRGEKVPKKILMEEKIFTKNNVDKELPLRTY